ncbi:hypothetical protein WR25_04248 [Diploscapter pachys]|uniref:K Homology domain-containing protein n=1 Tax=Diploscapter pachys TaxID=2018661 RepID=A0A2A2K1D5_9BILA|nr:hypothetical protein WR25_04248 [Diploscapter pachys]
MKRDHDGDHYNDDRGGRPKRGRSDGFSDAISKGRFELRLLVSGKAAGAVIGKGGENIKRLRSEFDSQISVPDSNAPERVVTVVAAIDNVVKIVEQMLDRLDEPQHAGEKGEKAEIRILVHQSHAGALIGRSGSKIKELRDKCNIRLKVFQQVCPNSTDRIVIVTGEPENCINALKHIVDDLKELPIKGPISQYNPQYYNMHDAFEYGGYQSGGMMGGGGGGGRGGRNDGGYPPRRDDYGGRGGGRAPYHSGGGNSGYGHHVTGGGGGGGGYNAGPGSAGHYPPPVAHHPIASVGNVYPPPQNFAPPGGPISTTQVTIPNELSGTIIGRGGERINRIRDETGATIILEQPQPGVRERIITISGTDQQIQSAQYHLQQCVRSSENGRRYIQQQERTGR